MSVLRRWRRLSQNGMAANPSAMSESQTLGVSLAVARVAATVIARR